MLSNYMEMMSVSPFEISQHINRCVGNHSIRLVGEKSKGKSFLKHLPNKDISFSIIQYGTDVEVIGPPQKDNYQIQLVLKGSCTINHCGQRVDLLSGDAAIINPSSKSSLIYKNNCEKLIVTLDSASVQSRLTKEISLKLTKPLNFDPRVQKNKDSGYLIHLLRFYGSFADKQKENNDFNLISNVMMDSIVNTLFKFQPSNYNYLLQANASAFPTHLKMALEYIDQNILNNFTINDILEITHVGERTLYKSFREHLNTTPLAYIKSLRLNKIRSALITHSSENIKITDLAMGFGFTHIGRFSQEYKSVFGELPSETLRKRGS